MDVNCATVEISCFGFLALNMQGEDNDSQVAGLVLGPSIGEAMASRVHVDPSPHHARNGVASRHDNIVGESASTTGNSEESGRWCTVPKALRHADMSTPISTSASMSTFRHSLFYST